MVKFFAQLHIYHLVFALCFSNCPAYSGIDSKRQFPLISWTRICVFTTEASQSGHVGSDNTPGAQNWLLCFVYNVFSYNFRDEHCAVYNVFYNYHNVHCTVYNMSSMCKSAVRSLKRCNALWPLYTKCTAKQQKNSARYIKKWPCWSVVWVGQKKCEILSFSAEIRFLRLLSCLERYSLQMQFKF